jgi:tetratricopeptide (TPR) repeat protein
MRNNRRRFLLFTATSLLWAAKGNAALREDNRQLAERYYDDAVIMLKNGHWYQRAIDKLSFCARTFPDNYAYHLALGCAQVSLLASHCAALENRERKKLTAEEIKGFLDQHKEKHPDGSLPTSEEIHAYFPAPDTDEKVTVLVLPDSNHSLVYDDESLSKRLRELASGAEESWKTAVSLSRTATQKKEALTTQVWGLRLLMTARGSLTSEGLPEVLSKEQRKGWNEAMSGAVDAVVALLPDRAESWALKGEVLSGFKTILWTASGEELEQTYEKALRCESENAAILFQLYQIATAGKNRSRAEMYLRRFVEAQKGNAYAHFCLAGYLATNLVSDAAKSPRTPEQEQREIGEIVRIVDRGLLASSYDPAHVSVEPPPILRPSMALLSPSVPIYNTVRTEFAEVVRTVLKFAKARADSDPALARRYCYSVLSLTKRVTPVTDVRGSSGDSTNPGKRIMDTIMRGMARSTYIALLDIVSQGGDANELARVQQEQQEYLARANAKMR